MHVITASRKDSLFRKARVALGALLAKVWDHFFSVVEACAGLRYEALVADARVQGFHTRTQLANAKKEADASNAKLKDVERQLKENNERASRDDGERNAGAGAGRRPRSGAGAVRLRSRFVPVRSR